MRRKIKGNEILTEDLTDALRKFFPYPPRVGSAEFLNLLRKANRDEKKGTKCLVFEQFCSGVFGIFMQFCNLIFVVFFGGKYTIEIRK